MNLNDRLEELLGEPKQMKGDAWESFHLHSGAELWVHEDGAFDVEVNIEKNSDDWMCFSRDELEEALESIHTREELEAFIQARFAIWVALGESE